MVSPDRDRSGEPSGIDGPEASPEPGPAHGSPSEAASPGSGQPESGPLYGGPPEAAAPDSGRPESGPLSGSPSKTAAPASAPLRLHADTDVCAGAGQCVRAAPDLFDQDEDGLVLLLRTDVPEQARERALTAADWCPSGAVSVHETS